MRSLIACCFCLLLATACYAGVFDVVKNLPKAERMAKAQDIYNNGVQLKDSVFAIASIEQLIGITKELNDKELECFGTSLLADQYARIRGANEYSTALHRKAIQLAEKNGSTLLLGICNQRMGRYYYSFKKYPLALEYLLRADNLFREIGYKEVPSIDEILFFLGSIYYETGIYDKAESVLKNIQELKKINNYIQKQSLNTLAMISTQQNDTVAALQYFQKALEVSVRQNDSTWIGICYSNIGNLYFSMKQYDKAYRILLRATQFSVVHKQWGDACNDLLLMARMDLLQNNPGAARKKMDSAQSLQNEYYTMQGRRNLYLARALYYEKNNEPAKALEEQRKLMEVKDSITASKDQQAYRKILLRIETEKYLSEIDKLETEAIASNLKRNWVIAFLVLLMVTSLSVFRLKTKKDAEILLQKQQVLRADKSKAEEKLKDARKLLQNFTENLRLKNQLIGQFATELEYLKKNIPDKVIHEERLNNFEKMVQSSILSDSEWEDFRSLFDKVYKGFFERLQQKFTGLSQQDTRLVSLVRLNLSTREMANMMGSTADAIGLLKENLRKKIHPAGNGILLEDLIQDI